MKQLYIILILIGALIAGSIYHSSVLKANEAETLAWQNRYAQTVDSMSVLTSGKDSALVQMSQRVNRIQIENEAIKLSLDDKNASLRYWAQMAASYKADLDDLYENTTQDTVIVDAEGDSVQVREFGVKLGLVSVRGNFDKYEPWSIRFSEARIDSLSLQIGVAENRDGTWDTYIANAPPGFSVKSMSALVSPYKDPWYAKIHLAGEVLLGTPLGVGVGIGYDQWAGKIYGTTAGVAIGAEYRIYPFRKER